MKLRCSPRRIRPWRRLSLHQSALTKYSSKARARGSQHQDGELFFTTRITQMDQARTESITVSEKLAARGLDVDPINNQLTELGDALKKSRRYVHSFSRNTSSKWPRRVNRPFNAPTRSSIRPTKRQISLDRSRCEHRAHWYFNAHDLFETSSDGKMIPHLAQSLIPATGKFFYREHGKGILSLLGQMNRHAASR